MKTMRWLTAVVACVGMASVVAAERGGAAPAKAAADADKGAIGSAVNDFAFDLYAKLSAQKGNLFYSPQSVSTALTMTWAGARGGTADQMAKVLHLPAEKPESIHAANAKLLASLSGSREKQGFELSVANALWGQKGYPWVADFLGLLKANYGAGLNEVDFVKDTEGARKTINLWVEQQTREKIKELIAEGVLDSATRLVLTNAIYFKGDWASQFKKDQTVDGDFFTEGDKKVSVPMMHQTGNFSYFDGGDFQVLELPYKGDALSMVILLPKAKDGLGAFEKTLSAEKVAGWVKGLRPWRPGVRVTLPKFQTTGQFKLNDTLSAMGMSLAFSGDADFSGMNGRKDLYISAVIHKAFVDVNEEGTEAAGATAVVMREKAMPSPPVEFRADHPFVFLIRDVRSGCILFLGRLADPKG